MTSSLPQVSIITPSFNQASFLESTIRSVLMQNYPKLEYLVIDGGSHDGSVDIIRKYEAQLAYWASETDSGQADAINKGFRRAQGEVVAWLNSDDMYLAGTLERAIQALQDNPAAGMVFGDGVLIDQHGNVLDWHRYDPMKALDLLSFEVILQPSVFMRRSALEKAGLLREEYSLILDHDLWLRIASQSELVYVPQYWSAERTYPEAKTMANAAEFVEEARRLVDWAEGDSSLGDLIETHRARVYSGLESFAARRMIDAGEYRQALRYFAIASRHSPAVGFRFWYKILQALMGYLGLEAIFLTYRSIRRRLQHRGQCLAWGEGGPTVRRGTSDSAKLSRPSDG